MRTWMLLVALTLGCGTPKATDTTDDTDVADTEASPTTDTDDTQSTDTDDTQSVDTDDTDTTPAPAPSCFGPMVCEKVAGGLIGGCGAVGCSTGACFGSFNDMPFFCDADETACTTESLYRGWCTWDADRGQCLANDRCYNTYDTSGTCNGGDAGSGNSCAWAASTCSGTAPAYDCTGITDSRDCRYHGCAWGIAP